MRYSAMVRYGSMATVAGFEARFSGLRLADRCVVRTERGVELGEIISAVQPTNDGPEADGERRSKPGEILRRMTADDLEKERGVHEQEEPAEFRFCQKRIRERELPMKLASVEHLFGGNKIIFYFLADGRVDFRELVKDLAQEYQTRIEMRQIGVRDEARLLADFEHCGRELCCRTFLRSLEPVTMKMAKNQKATLDPNKISGRCGRLMCCLRFEDRVYDDLRSQLPRKGTRVKTPSGVGTVLSQDILRQEVSVATDENQQVVVPLADIEMPPPRAHAERPCGKAPADSCPGTCPQTPSGHMQEAPPPDE